MRLSILYKGGVPSVVSTIGETWALFVCLGRRSETLLGRGAAVLW